MDESTDTPKRRRLTLNPDEVQHWIDVVKAVYPTCIVMTEGSHGCRELVGQSADDAIRELRLRLRK